VVAVTVAALVTMMTLKVALAAFFRGCLGNKFRGHFLGSCFSNSSTTNIGIKSGMKKNDLFFFCLRPKATFT